MKADLVNFSHEKNFELSNNNVKANENREKFFFISIKKCL